MLNEVDQKTEERSINLMKKVLIGLGGIFILVGIIRQWPIVGKSYMEFIEGEGYLALMLGLIMTVLGISVKLLIGHEKQ
jgi:ABC-type Co2+ transport system permease subunit